MTNPIAVASRSRIRLGLIVLVAGVVLIVWAWGSWIFRSTLGALPLPGVESPAPSEGGGATPPASGLAWLLVVAVVLLIAVISGGHILGRSSRRFYAKIARSSSKQTASDDVWSMHKLPNERDGS